MAITRVKASSLTQGLPKKKTILAGNDVILPGSYDYIDHTVVGVGGTSSITFTSIPQTYKHLQIRCFSLKTTNPGTLLRINNDSTAGNYPQHILYGDGTSASAYADITNYTGFVWGLNDNGSSTAPAVSIIDILDYTNTNKLKTMRSLSAADRNGAGIVSIASCINKTITAAITSITFSGTSANFNQYSSFALYGIK